MKQRVLIVNKFYYPRGGDCIVAMNLERMLKEHEHEVAVLAMEFPENVDSGWNSYYASQVAFDGSLLNKLRATTRLMGWGNINRTVEKILDDFKPDVVHLHNIHSYLSPVVAKLAKRRGCRVVWTLHDFKLMCPAYSCLDSEGKLCERCVGGGKWHVVSNKCIKGSLAPSLAAWLEALKWNRRLLSRYTDVFICPSQLMASKMQEDGFDAAKLCVVCNFLTPAMEELLEPMDSDAREDYYCYVGRLSPEKGIDTLLQVASRLPFQLKVAGDGPLSPMLHEKYGHAGNIQFLGRCDAHQVAQLLSKARFSVMPSECYDNNPLAVIESLCAGTPVVGASTGGIPELINTCSNGLLFAPGNGSQLASAITRAFETTWNNSEIKRCAMSQFSVQAYYHKLIELYANQ